MVVRGAGGEGREYKKMGSSILRSLYYKGFDFKDLGNGEIVLFSLPSKHCKQYPIEITKIVLKGK